MDTMHNAPMMPEFGRFAFSPSLASLSHALRHPETWPPGFVWDYARCGSCAMGLAFQLWNERRSEPEPEPDSSDAWHHWTALRFAMPHQAVDQIFIGLRAPWSWLHPLAQRTAHQVTPGQVATAIDRYLLATA